MRMVGRPVAGGLIGQSQRTLWRSRWMSALRSLLALAAVVAAAQALGQPAVSLSDATPAVFLVPTGVLEGLTPEMGVADVAALDPGQFRPLVAGHSYRVGREAPLWLRLTLVTTQPLERSPWRLEFPSVIVDRYEVYQRDAGAQWQVAAAGDRVAHREWPLDSLKPQFALLLGTAGEHVVFVRVVHQLPVSLRPLIVHESVAARRDSTQMLWTGLLAGVLLTLVLTCVQMGWSFREPAYGWYGAFLASTAMAGMCYTGVAQRSFWPDATRFSSAAIVVAVMVALAFNLMFGRAMFASTLGRAARIAVSVLAGLCLVYALVTLLDDRYDRHIPYFNALTLSGYLCILVMAAHAWRRGVAFGGYFLLVYLPYLCGIGLTLMESTGLIEAPWLTTETPMAAGILEAVAMLLCINAYGRQRHAQTVRDQTAARRDPLTGFLHLAGFRERAARFWGAAARVDRDVAVIYVAVDPVQADPQTVVETEALMARSVRLVRAATREFDTVGRLGRNRLGIVMINVPPGEALSNRLARLVALGLMHDPHDPSAVPVRFRLAVGARCHFPGDFGALDLALRAMLDQDDTDGRAIRYLAQTIPVRRVGEVPGAVAG